jgi:hypothetical protein
VQGGQGHVADVAGHEVEGARLTGRGEHTHARLPFDVVLREDSLDRLIADDFHFQPFFSDSIVALSPADAAGLSYFLQSAFVQSAPFWKE